MHVCNKETGSAKWVSRATHAAAGDEAMVLAARHHLIHQAQGLLLQRRQRRGPHLLRLHDVDRRLADFAGVVRGGGDEVEHALVPLRGARSRYVTVT
jgi:hypothetical protein